MESSAQKINFQTLKATCQNCSLAELCLPRGLDTDDMQTLDEIIQQRILLQKKQLVFEQGSKSGCIYAVRSGCVKTYTTAKDGEEQILGFHLPGEILGLDGLDNKIHSCSAVALNTSTVCELPINDLNLLCVKMPGLQQQLLSLISEEISKDHTMLLLLARRNAEQKLATFLSNVAERLKTRGYSGDVYELTMSRSEIGNYLGIAEETVSRLLTKLRDMKIISVDRKNIEILNHDKLTAVAEGS